ncbi:unnamed protein product, partial [Iphiclides podalirius]
MACIIIDSLMRGAFARDVADIRRACASRDLGNGGWAAALKRSLYPAAHCPLPPGSPPPPPAPAQPFDNREALGAQGCGCAGAGAGGGGRRGRGRTRPGNGVAGAPQSHTPAPTAPLSPIAAANGTACAASCHAHAGNTPCSVMMQTCVDRYWTG